MLFKVWLKFIVIFLLVGLNLKLNANQSKKYNPQNAPIKATANRQIFDIKNSQIILNQDVTVTQGDYKLFANEVFFKRNSKVKKDEYLEAFGNPVKFERQMPNNKTIKGQGESLRYDLKSERLVLNNGKQVPNIKVTQDGVILVSNKVVFNRRQTAKQNQYLQAFGTPVRFSKQMPDHKVVNGEGKTIHYDLKTEVATLEGGAKLWQQGNSIKGNKIIYNGKIEQLKATGNKSNRVRTVFIPEAKN